MASNGRLPASSLAPIGGGYFLRKDAAAAFLAMRAEGQRRYGFTIEVVAGYRSFQRQVELYQLYLSGRGNLAAHPGTSNHGLGLAVDLSTQKARWIVDQIGRYYGFSKACSDAQSEWWHIVYNPACTGAKFHPGPSFPSHPTLHPGQHSGWVKHLQRLIYAKGFHVRINGKMDHDTVWLVREIQKNWHLKQDGIVGPATWAVMHKKLNKRRIKKRWTLVAKEAK